MLAKHSVLFGDTVGEGVTGSYLTKPGVSGPVTPTNLTDRIQVYGNQNLAISDDRGWLMNWDKLQYPIVHQATRERLMLGSKYSLWEDRTLYEQAHAERTFRMLDGFRKNMLSGFEEGTDLLSMYNHLEPSQMGGPIDIHSYVDSINKDLNDLYGEAFRYGAMDSLDGWSMTDYYGEVLWRVLEDRPELADVMGITQADLAPMNITWSHEIEDRLEGLKKRRDMGRRVGATEQWEQPTDLPGIVGKTAFDLLDIVMEGSDELVQTLVTGETKEERDAVWLKAQDEEIARLENMLVSSKPSFTDGKLRVFPKLNLDIVTEELPNGKQSYKMILVTAQQGKIAGKRRTLPFNLPTNENYQPEIRGGFVKELEALDNEMG